MKMPDDTTPRTIYSIQAPILAGVFCAYILIGSIGLAIHASGVVAMLFWPSSGIALATLILYDGRAWPAVFCAAFLVSVLIGVPPLIALGIAGANVIGSLIGAALVKEYHDYHASILRARDNVGIVGSAFLIPFITATIGAGGVWIAGEILPGMFLSTWNNWWLGDALSILILTPFIVTWFREPYYERSRLQIIELFLTLGAVVATCIYVFWVPQSPFYDYLFFPLTWAALRTGPRGTTLAILLASGITFTSTLLGHGPFAGQVLLYLEVFMLTMSAIFLIITTIVEERRHALETLEQHINELEIALHKISTEDEAKKEYLAVLAHELRNPLATILSSIELIHMEVLSVPKSMGRLLETINERARAMVHLLDDLLDISRISQKKLKLHKENVALNHFIDMLVLAIQPLMRRYGHTFSVTRPEEELFLDADPTRLDQIFINLLTNAAKYTKPPGFIEITAKREGNMAVVHICDTGMGIPRNMLRRIFEPFFQLNQGQKEGEGIGMGLALTRQLVEMHGGTIEARSAGVNSGSEFVVKLPLAAAPIEQKPSGKSTIVLRKNNHSSRQQKRTFKILIVDDNKEATEALARLLRLRGHTTAYVHFGSQAASKALQFEPEVVFLDIGLPDMTGYEVAKILLEQKKPYYLIALTGYGQAEDKERAKEAGIHFHLTKPAGLKEIEAALRKVPYQ